MLCKGIIFKFNKSGNNHAKLIEKYYLFIYQQVIKNGKVSL